MSTLNLYFYTKNDGILEVVQRPSINDVFAYATRVQEHNEQYPNNRAGYYVGGNFPAVNARESRHITPNFCENVSESVLQPPSGYRFEVAEVRLVMDTTVDCEQKILRYIGYNIGEGGTDQFERVYSSQKHYRQTANEVSEVNNVLYYKWVYKKPIILRSSYGAYLKIQHDNGIWEGNGEARVTIYYIVTEDL